MAESSAVILFFPLFSFLFLELLGALQAILIFSSCDLARARRCR